MSAHEPSDPRDYDYSSPARTCDMVMKGGITSGVVYPHAVCELARTYRFKSVGGASAGAIAAAATAAAELGRDARGFQQLAELPAWVAENLFSVFQPQKDTQGLFALLTAAITPGPRQRLRLLGAALRSFPIFTALAAAPGLALLVVGALATSGATRVVVILGGLLLALVGAALGLVFGIVRSASHDIPANYFGLCSGMAGAKAGSTAPLTVWLGELLERLANRDPAGPPLTFRDLWRGDEPDATPESVRLEMMTTNLTNRRPHRLPWDERVFLFDPTEFRDLFPERVVEWMLDHPSDPRDRGPTALRQSELRTRLLDPLRPWPDAGDLPVVVATRMSLSFPLLISAVPLWSVDMSSKANQQAALAWEKWLDAHEDEWEQIKDDRSAWRDTPAEALVAERCWFSDGGISSNFPVHFFDSPVPVRPTFAIDLTGFGPGEEPDGDESENVWLPPTNQGGLLETWYRFGPSGPGQLVGFGSAVVRTMQNRVDSAQMRVPGYRDRIVHVKFTGKEGGMNLTMPAPVITALTKRGQWAGAKLVRRFHLPPGKPGELSWDNHRWIRFRSSLAVLGELVQRFASGYSLPPEVAGERTYEELAARGDEEPPTSYRWANESQQTLAADATRQVVALGEELTDDEESLAKGAPSPQPEARIVPRL